MIGMEDGADSAEGGFGGNAVVGILAPEEVADIVVRQAVEGRFLILTHRQVATYVQRKAHDHDRWIKGMQRFRKQLQD